MKCDEKLSEAWVGLGEEEVAVNEDETATAIATETIGQSEMGTAAEDMLNDVERRIWAAWDTRDQNAVVSTPAFFHQDNDLTRVASGSSLSQNINAHSCHQEIRNDAQNRLLQHAEKAVDMFGFRADHMAGTMSTESSISHGPKQKLEGDIPVPWLSTALSFEQRAVLKDFSSNLKNDGVQVMKLSRRNRWQIRYLTVSKEVSRLSSDQDGSKNIEQCPKALLWPKRIVRSQKCSISSIKSGGQGGLHFERLLQIRPVVSNEYYDTNLSKRLKREFPVFAGVAVDFSYEGGGQRQLHLCFRTKIDAEAFVATMHIIREAAERSTTLPNKDRLIESYATESSGTKSFDS